MDEHAAPPMQPIAVGATGAVQPHEDQRPRRGWIWALVIVAVLLVTFVACGAFAVSGLSGGSSAPGLGQRIALIHIDDAISGTGGSGFSIIPYGFFIIE